MLGFRAWGLGFRGLGLGCGWAVFGYGALWLYLAPPSRSSDLAGLRVLSRGLNEKRVVG